MEPELDWDNLDPEVRRFVMSIVNGIGEFSRNVLDLSAEVHDLDHTIRTYMSGAEVERRIAYSSKIGAWRRAFTATMLVIVFLFGFQISDQHVESCGPGARAEKVVEVYGKGETDGKVLRSIANRRVAGWCDVTFPVHTHSPGDQWPTGANNVGLSMYAIALAALGFWVHTKEPKWAEPGSKEAR